MHARKESPWVTLEPRAFYSVALLARVANIARPKFMRILRANDVQFLRAGRAVFVPLSEILTKPAQFWQSLQLIEGLRTGRGDARLARPGSPSALQPQG